MEPKRGIPFTSRIFSKLITASKQTPILVGTQDPACSTIMALSFPEAQWMDSTEAKFLKDYTDPGTPLRLEEAKIKLNCGIAIQMFERQSWVCANGAMGLHNALGSALVGWPNFKHIQIMWP